MSTPRPLTKLVTPLAAATLALGVGLAGTGAEAAPAPKAKVSVTIMLNSTSKVLKGVVSSPMPACKKGRGVQLFFKSPGGTSFTKVRTAVSAAGGAWKVPAPGGAGSTIPPGRYYVKILTNAKCKPAQSRTISAAAG